MKEIKVRCWDGEKMIYPEYFNLHKQTAHWTENSIPAQSNIFMLYTGLKDKNRKEIFEEDIIRFSGGKKAWTVTWDNEWARFVGHSKTVVLNLLDERQKYEIVGNVYQNPDLLK